MARRPCPNPAGREEQTRCGPARGHSPKSMRSLWFRCSRASSSCLSGADVSLGMLVGQRQHDALPTRGQWKGWERATPGTYVGTSVLFLS